MSEGCALVIFGSKGQGHNGLITKNVKLGKMNPALNGFPIAPIIMKLHTKTPHESRMCPIDFWVKRSRWQCIDYWKWIMLHIFFPFTPIIMKLHTETPHESRNFGSKSQRSRSQCIDSWKWFMLHNCFPFTSAIIKLYMYALMIMGSNVKVTMHWLLKMVYVA